MKAIVFIVILALSIGFGLLIYRDPGYALFSYDQWSVEMPIWLVLVLICAIVLLLFFLANFFQAILECVDWVKPWRYRRRKRLSRNYTSKGLLAFAEGHWHDAEKKMVKGAQYSDTPLIFYLMAARAAQKQKIHDRRDHYLQLAHEASEDADLAVHLTQAELQFKQKQYEQCLATVKSLSEYAPRHMQVLKWKYKVYLALGDFQSLYRVYPILKKEKVITKTEAYTLEKQIFSELLDRGKKQDDIITLWDCASKAVTESPELIAQYVKFLLIRKAEKKAEIILQTALKKQWDESLIYLYGLIKGVDLKKQLDFVEIFLRSYQNNAILLLTLGRLSIFNQLWGKAKDYLQASVHLKPNPETYAILANLLDRLGETDESQSCYQKGLMLAVEPL